MNVGAPPRDDGRRMTVTRVTTVAFEGIEAREVDVQVQITSGGNKMMIVGLPDKAVAESQERVKSALHAIGLALPPKRIVVNLAPADLPKEGSHYDLPIAMGLLAAMGVLPIEDMARTIALGELALDGQVTAVAGVLPAALAAATADKALVSRSGRVRRKRPGLRCSLAGSAHRLTAKSRLGLVTRTRTVPCFPSYAAFDRRRCWLT